MQSFQEFLKERDPVLAEEMGRALTSILAGTGGMAAGLAVGGIPGAFGGMFLGKELAWRYLPEKGFLKSAKLKKIKRK